jgi:hypothetical protein
VKQKAAEFPAAFCFLVSFDFVSDYLASFQRASSLPERRKKNRLL